jgi:hypothetical protein
MDGNPSTLVTAADRDQHEKLEAETHILIT